MTRTMDPQVVAIDRFCRAQYARLVGLIGLYLHDRHLAEEVAQDALVRVYRAWDRFPSERDAERWLTRVAFNLANSDFRMRARRRRVLERYGPSMAVPAPDDAVAEVIAVRRAVATLPERCRQAVVLRYYADLPVAEVSRIMGCPEGTVKTLTRDGIHRLRQAGLDVTDD